MIQLTLTLRITTAQVVETSVTVNNSPIQDYVHPDNHPQLTYGMTPRFKPYKILNFVVLFYRADSDPCNVFVNVITFVRCFFFFLGMPVVNSGYITFKESK